MKGKHLFLVLVFIVLSLAGRGSKANAAPQRLQPANTSTRYLYLSRELDGPGSRFEVEWLRRRKQAQEGRARQYKIVHDFKFLDRLRESGITFQNSVVDDATKSYKAIHYDHGTGCCWRTSPRGTSTVKTARLSRTFSASSPRRGRRW